MRFIGLFEKRVVSKEIITATRNIIINGLKEVAIFVVIPIFSVMIDPNILEVKIKIEEDKAKLTNEGTRQLYNCILVISLFEKPMTVNIA